jgi:hypothetical protein
MKKLVALALAFAFTVGATLSASAQVRNTCEGVTLPRTVTVDGTTLNLNGLGIREASAFQVDVYVAGLYLETASTNAEEILASDTRKRIVLRFVHDVERQKIVDAFTEGFQNNGGGAAGLAARRTQLMGWMTDMVVGNTMTFTYVPGTGLTVNVNGSNKGTITGADFQRAFFALFIGPNPPNRGLKVGLLGGRCG